jgi:Heavy-metal resistance
VLAALALAAAVGVETPGPRADAFWRWWENPAIVADVGLMPRQASEIGRLQAESQRRRAEMLARLREERRRLGALLSAPRVDAGQIARVVGRISRQQRDLLRSIIHVRVKVRRLLTQDQLGRLLARHPMLMQRPWEDPRARDPAR